MFKLIVLGLGSVLAVLVCNLFVDKIYVKIQEQHKGAFYPEGRLPLVVFGAWFLPLVVVFYGWSAALHWPAWIFLCIVVLVGFAILISIVPMVTYVTDSFGIYSASAFTAVLIVRCLAGTFLPLATAPLLNAFGYGYGFMIVAAPCLLLAPIPALVMRYGPRWRQKSSFTEEEDPNVSLT